MGKEENGKVKKTNKTTKFWVQSSHLRGFELDIRSLRWPMACARARREEGRKGGREAGRKRESRVMGGE